ncbi:SUMF1/EgtB/PvdO family nonheme iron enzyme [bacterium]
MIKILLIIAVLGAAAMLCGCGGGGGSSAPATGKEQGRLSAEVHFPRRTGTGRSAAAATGTISVDISVTGYYGNDGTAFTPVTAHVDVDASASQGSATILEVPVGVNHLMTAIAEYPDGAMDTIKCIVPEIARDTLTRETADQRSTVISDAAIVFASQRGVNISKLSQSDIEEIATIVDALYAAGYSYDQITAEMVMDYQTIGTTVASIIVFPATATVAVGLTQQFTAAPKNSYGVAVDASVTWSVDGGIGTIDSAGLFTASTAGEGSVAAISGNVTGSASVTVTTSAVCGNGAVETGEDCDDGGESATCDSDCTAATCGDSAANATAGETCDDGNTTTETCAYGQTSCTVCDSVCASVAGATSYCGDNTTDSSNGEACDDGNTTTETCAYGQTSCSVCNSTCQSTAGATSFCGDSITDASNSEACDDGINNGTTGYCSSSCDGTVECYSYADCDDSDPDTIDVCTNAGTASSACSYTDANDSIAAGDYQSCSLESDNSIKCWGGNVAGELGDGTGINSVIPVQVSGISTATGVSAQYYLSCAVLSDGTVNCWGDNQYGQLGDGTTNSSNVPVAVSGINTAVSVRTGKYHACAVLSDGSLKCWGRNNQGQLGDGTTTDSSTPMIVPGITNAAAAAAARDHSCILLGNGTVKCWGDNVVGQLGDGTTTDSLAPVSVSGITAAAAITANGYHTCVLLVDGTVECWGDNSYGMLGDGTTVNSSTPVAAVGISTAVSVSAGDDHTCAVLSGGTMNCWGRNTYGQLGRGTAGDSFTPVSVSGISSAVGVSGGGFHTCAALADGTLKCWGYNVDGQLGTGEIYWSDNYSPLTVYGTGPYACWLGALDCDDSDSSTADLCLYPGTTSAACYNTPRYKTLMIGNYHSCRVEDGGTVKCWGRNDYGQLGDGTTTDSAVPVSVSGITTATGVYTGANHTCAALQDGSLECWGDNTYGQLGDGTTTNSSVPVSASGVASVISAGTGDRHTCALLSDGTVKCWGDNGDGQLGDGTNTASLTPVTVLGITTKAVMLGSGDRHGCVLLQNGTARCWGRNNYGDLGDGTNNFSNQPVSVFGLANAVSISCGNGNGCSLLDDATVTCWGLDSAGGTHSNVPAAVDGIADAVYSEAGGYHFCSVISGGTVKCWGENSYGNLGDGTTDTSWTPVTVSGITTATSVTANLDHTCALLTGGIIKCWGDNYYGQLGDGETATDSNTPVFVVDCGNGNVDTGEECDDGNLASGDGCSATCLNDAKDTNAWITIPASDFVMGCADADVNCTSPESPKHTVTLSGYQIQKYEVTNAQYQACVDAAACTAPTSVDSSTRSPYYGNATYDNYPVVFVDWTQAEAYCTWIGGRLPTEAEWEKAARGPYPAESIYPWGDDTATCSLANYSGCTGDTEEVGSHPTGASTYSVVDIAGNVYEWVNDQYASTYYTTGGPPWIDPTGPGTVYPHVLRGGSWMFDETHLRASNRSSSNPYTGNWLGFRCAQD